MLVTEHETRTGRRATGGSALFPRTKFHRAPVRAEHVGRLPLLTGMEASHARIVLLTASPGFGKSTLLAGAGAAA
ncbi:MAG: hypothetical protein M3065_13730 [Actinomycetota bacterium]|nr:hypothetical protein [Actinomycetota bacterium]